MDLQEAIKICHSSTSKKYISENNITQEQVFEAVDLLCDVAEKYIELLLTNKLC